MLGHLGSFISLSTSLSHQSSFSKDNQKPSNELKYLSDYLTSSKKNFPLIILLDTLPEPNTIGSLSLDITNLSPSPRPASQKPFFKKQKWKKKIVTNVLPKVTNAIIRRSSKTSKAGSECKNFVEIFVFVEGNCDSVFAKSLYSEASSFYRKPSSTITNR